MPSGRQFELNGEICEVLRQQVGEHEERRNRRSTNSRATHRRSELERSDLVTDPRRV